MFFERAARDFPMVWRICLVARARASKDSLKKREDEINADGLKEKPNSENWATPELTG